MRDLINETLFATARTWVSHLLGQHSPERATLDLLAFIALQLQDVHAASAMGRSWRMTPVVLGTDVKRIIDRNPLGNVRKVQIAIDSAVGGAPITVRVGENVENTTTGGFLLATGELHDLGEVGPDVLLRGVASRNITAYVIEKF